MTRVALVGLGHQSLNDHIPALEKIPGIRITAFADTDEKKLSEMSRRCPLAQSTANYRDINTDVIDAVVISLPHFLHYDAVSYFLERKIPVFKEKPAALTAEEAYSLANLSNRHDTTLMVGVQRRFLPHYTYARELIHTRIGQLFYVDARYSIFTNEPHVGWRGQRRFAGGGCIIDMGYHIIDQLVLLLGKPEQLTCESSHRFVPNFNYDAEDTARMIFKYQTGLWGSLLISRVLPPKIELIEVFGSAGTVRIAKKSVELLTVDGKLIEKFDSPANEDPVKEQFKNFFDSINGKAGCLSPIADHLDQMRFVDMCYQPVSGELQYA